ncbi:MAG: alpha amylase C-terminal domain-containing protein [Cyclobacteriaceae bacterium]
MAKKKLPILAKNDVWLEPYADEIQGRIDRYKTKLEEIKKEHKSLKSFAEGYSYFGFNHDNKKKGWWYREWAPKAKGLSLIGDFNGWDRNSHPLQRNDQGIWEIFLSSAEVPNFGHGSRVKVHISSSKEPRDRIPAYIKYAVQPEGEIDYVGEIYHPEKKFDWTDKSFQSTNALEEPYIYECHVGMAQEKEGLGTYREFADLVLPRIKKQGYNAIQVMAVQEHPYYGSFGYHVSSFFAPSSRFGNPDDLRYMVNKAHEVGIAVIMDIVHSHAVKNIAEGLNEFDGSDDQYFHPGGKGYHDGWDSKLFNYGKDEVLRFLLSNVRYWLEEFHFDGFRYDGVTSMLYFHHGNISFDNYGKYFEADVDWDVLTYMQLASTVAKQVKKSSILIAEDMSGMPGLCRPVKEGGLGFDFRLAMGIPDFWIKYLKEKTDDTWNIHEMWGTMTNRRFGERTIAYAESHDQALVGDKTMAFWLMDKEMYFNMHVDHENIVVDRGIALHKMIRLFSLSLGGEGYLNFIGNEFGHPEWIDFPREGNNWSYKYARRQWSLADNQDLKYKYLNAFDQDMIEVAKTNHLLASDQAKQLNMDEDNQTIIFERHNLIFMFNFHHSNAIPDYRFRLDQKGEYEIILNSDSAKYGGFSRVDEAMNYPTVTLFGEDFLSTYLPNRTCLVLKRVKG